MRAKTFAGVLVVMTGGLLVVGSAVRAEAPYALAWTRQLGTGSYDGSLGVAVDATGNVYITGWTEGDLGWANAGGRDAFLSKYNGSGTLAWTRQLGSGSTDYAYDVDVDTGGNVYITGATRGDLVGANAGGDDGLLSKYDGSGTLAWTRQFGTGSNDASHSVAVGTDGNMYVTGNTGGDLGGMTNAGGDDAFLSKYDGSGTLVWTRLLGTDRSDYTRSVAADTGGNVYITGYTNGDLDGPNAGNYDAFLSKYDGSGTLSWTRQLGTGPSDWGYGVAVDTGGNVYITGNTSGDLGGANAGINDAFLSKYDGSGTLAWTRQLGTSSGDGSTGVAADADGNVYITGFTDGNLGGPNAGGRDTFLSKYDGSGTLAWTRQLGTGSVDVSYGVTVDADGNVYITGWTYGDLGGPNAGGADAFLAKYVIPEPATLLLLCAAVPVLSAIRHRRKEQPLT